MPGTPTFSFSHPKLRFPLPRPLRWGAARGSGQRGPATGGGPTCPKCGCIDVNGRPGRHFRCKSCKAWFSVTSRTSRASRKLNFKALPRAIVLSVLSVKGKAASQLKRELDVDYKTVLLRKLREAIAILRRGLKLDGTAGVHVGGRLRTGSRKEDRVDCRLGRNRTASRLSPPCRTSAPIWPGTSRETMSRGAGLRADQPAARDNLSTLNEPVRNNHSKACVGFGDWGWQPQPGTRCEFGQPHGAPTWHHAFFSPMRPCHACSEIQRPMVRSSCATVAGCSG